MQKAIYKYLLEQPFLNAVLMPRGAKLLSVQVQTGNITVWALIDTDPVVVSPPVCRMLYVVGTGWQMNEEAKLISEAAFLGTVQLEGGRLVFHVFDAGEA